MNRRQPQASRSELAYIPFDIPSRQNCSRRGSTFVISKPFSDIPSRTMSRAGLCPDSLSRCTSSVQKLAWPGHSPWSLQALEERKKLVVRSIPPRLCVKGGDRVEHALLKFEVCIQIDLRRLDGLMPEPEREDGLFDALL